MGQVIPRQHPAVVLKSHYKALRALLAAALIAIAALSAAVVILANDDDNTKESVQPAVARQQALPPGTRFDGGPDEGTRGIQATAPAPGTRFDGGPDEGTRGPQAQSYWQTAEPRTSYQPPAGMKFKEHAGGPRFIPMGPSN
ncbi:MAG TPA: hypothetical protein VJT68_00670 [Thermoleophilaceae bacterium]|nr:hypothetical protein [Thermoleophilaceae bacterium]